MHLPKLFFLLILIVGTISCNSSLNSNDEPDNVPKLKMKTSVVSSQTTTFNGDTLVFKGLGYVENPENYPSFTSQINDHQIVINGFYYASSGFTPATTFNRDGNKITIGVHAPKSSGGPSMPTAYLYKAYITNLSKGKYEVQIIHKNDFLRTSDKNHKDTVFSHLFTIQ